MMNRDWVDKDFYKVLGVSKNADAKEIKRAYRKLAQRYHPDANPNDAKAEEKFKDISEAYATLSNEEQRKEYDEVRQMVDSGGFRGFQSGPSGFGAGQKIRFEDLGDLFGGGLGNVFGFGGTTSRRSGPQRGADTSAELHLSFEDAIRGVTTTVSVKGETVCRTCRGSGAEPGTPVETCPTCHGSGMVAQSQGFFSTTRPCPTCGGTGTTVRTPCHACHGTGTTTRVRTIKVKIPAGVKNGAVVRLKGKGTPGRNGGPAGDLLVKVHVARHKLFRRAGDNLKIKVPITFTEAALGTEITVPTLDEPVRLKVPAGTRSGRTFRVRGRGVKKKKGRPGDLLVTVEVVVPTRLSREAKKMLQQFAEEFEAGINPREGLEV
ncbi:MAG TPA: molecular chaperone DnaJ [Actinobacteria bacterium]|nr:molecular chaperone DnaJ [Actinomycetota bacterium]